MAAPMFADFVSDAWRAACYNRCKPSTRKRVDSALKTQLLPSFGAAPLDRISRRAVHRWFGEYSRTAPAGANRALDVLRQIFSHAVVCGLIATNPTRGLKRNPRPQQTRFLSHAEIKRLNSALGAHRGRGSGEQQAEIIRLLLLTGCRKGELVRLRWGEVEGDVLRLADAKTGPRTVYLNAQARAILARQPRVGSPWVFPSRRDPARCRPPELSLWRKVRRKAGIHDVRLHDLRHTFASHAVLRGVPVPVVSRLLGHARPRVTLRYTHVSDRETEAAAERIGSAIARVLAESPDDNRDQTPEPAESWRRVPHSPENRTNESTTAVSAQELRRSLGSVLDRLERGGRPIVLSRRRRPAAVLVTLRDYRDRFPDRGMSA